MLDPLYTPNNILNSPLEMEEVRKIVDKAKSRKAAGIDNIPNEVLKNQPVIKCLHALFQMCFDHGLIPTAWTQAIICPIPKSKSNDPRLPLSYRGLSILSCIYKIYSSILNARILKYWEDNGILNDEQNGFRSKRSCLDHIHSIFSIVRNRLNSGNSVFTCMVDFRKAFDLVPRELLLFRLLEYGIDGKIYNAVKNIYSQSTCAVRINDSMTSWFSTDQGVKQGDNLSPTLFSGYVNSLISDLKATGIGVKIGTDTVSVLAYADDLILTAENELDLQKLLDILCEWCHKWRLVINTDKTKVLHFRKKNTPKTGSNFKVNDVDLEIVTEYKYLGVLLNENLDYSKCAELLAGAAGRDLGSVINKVKIKKVLGYNTFTTLVDNCVVPILCYGSGVWGLKYQKCCDDVLLRASRYYMGVHRLTPIPGIQGDMGWLDCKNRWVIEIVRLYNRFINMDADRLNKRIFIADKDLCKDNWSKKVYDILSEFDLLNFWNNNQVVPLELIKNKVKAKFDTDWEYHCSTKPKLRTYTTFKSNTDTATHLKCNLPKYERSIISQFRLGILPLRIETGRYSNLPLNERTCVFCNSAAVENEVHFAFECDFYNVERAKFQNSIGISLDNLDNQGKFDAVFKHPYALGKYLKSALKKRKDHFYRSTR